MDIVLVISASLLGLAAGGSGFAKFKKVPAVISSLTSVGVKSTQIPLLATLEISGTFGLVVGIWNKKLGTLSSFCLTLFFLGAVISHLRKKHRIADFGPALVIFMISVLSTVLQFRR